MDSSTTTTPKNWVEPTEPLAAIQNLITGCLLAQSRGAYSLEDSSALWDSIKYLISLQSKLRDDNKNINDVLQEELGKSEDDQYDNESVVDSVKEH